MSTENGTVVSARDVTRRYGEGETAVDALRGVSVEVPRGKLTAVMGPSGSGKSTLMHILAGLDKPTSGSVAIAGTEITTLKDSDLTKLRRSHIGFVFQFFNLLPMLTAEENITLPLSIAGEKPEPAFFDELIASVGLGDRLSHRPSELSGGQQQRVAIARALVSRPDVVFADEPTGNLDSKTGGEILELLRHSVEELGQTIVMVTHEARAAAIADRVLYLADGSIVRELQGATPARDLRDDGRDRARRDALRSEEPARPQVPHGPDRARDRPRRRDDQRHLRPHGHDRQGVLEHLRRLVRRHGRRRQRQGGGHLASTSRSRQRAAGRRVAPRRGPRASTRVDLAMGGIYDELNTKIIGEDGKAINTNGAPSFGFGLDTVARVRRLQPAQPARGPLARGRRRGRRRRRHRRPGGLRARRDDRDLDAAAEAGLRGRRDRAVRRRQVARERDVRDLRRRDRADALRPRGPVRRDLRRGRGGHRRPRSWSPTSSRCCRPTRRCKTGAEEAQEGSDDIGEFTTFIRYFLLAFAGIALFVGSFVIFNTLSITVAQRTREFATLRTLGASRRQVLRSVLVEAFVIGLLASLVGLVLGFALAKGLEALFGALGLGLPPPDTVFATRTIVVSLLVGTLVTVARGALPGDPRDARAADRGGPRGRDAAARAVRALHAVRRARADRGLALPARLLDVRRRRRHGAAAALDRGRRAAAVRRGGDDLVEARPAARRGRRAAGALDRRRRRARSRGGTPSATPAARPRPRRR